MSLETNLILILLMPLLSILLTITLNKNANLRECSNIAVACINFFLSILAYTNFSNKETILLKVIDIKESLYIGFYFEPITLMFTLMVNLLWIISLIYSMGYLRAHKEKKQSRFFVFYSLSIWCTLGIATSSNLLTTFLFYEALTLSTFPLVAHNINKKNSYSVKVYLGVLVASSLVFLFPAILLCFLKFGTLDYINGGLFAKHENTDHLFTISILLLFIFGIAKTGVMPLHKWLPAAMIAPTPVSALLHAVAVVKSGAFILIKVIVYIFDISYLNKVIYEIFSINWLLLIPSITIIYASIIAFYQDNLKKRLAYSTISQLSYIVLGALILTKYGISSAIFHIFAHGIAKITLFFAAGSIIVLAHKNNVSELAGIGKKMPITMIAFSISALSMIGFPLTPGFISKWILLVGIWESNEYWLIIVIILSTILSSLYFLPIIFKAFFENENIDSLKSSSSYNIQKSTPMDIAMTITTVGVITLYIYSNHVINILTNQGL